MDEELEELESIISDHFGRTPLSTPLCSQNSELNEDLTDLNDEDHDDETLNVENVIDGRAREYLHRADDDASSSEDEVSENLATLRNTDNDFQRVQSFNQRGCECTKKCSAKFTVEEIYDHILNVREMTKDEKELYIMGVVGEVTNNDKTKRGKKRQRMRHVFRFHGQVVCKGTFLLCYDIGRTSLQNIIKHIEEQGLTPRRHGNKGKTKPHSLKYEDVQRVVRFICNHADEKGLPQPAAPRGTDNIPPIYLSAETTKKSLHDEYVTASAQVTPPVRTVKLSAFKTIWLTCLPHIKIASPKDDVCATCEKIRKMIIDAVDEESKLTASTDMRNHVLQAQKERELYNDCIRRSRESHLRQVDGYTHYTFDFSQNINLPHFSRQMGPLYFLSLLKVQLFGFRIDGEPRQLNFLIGEDETMGIDGSETHGPNAVISMVDWALQTYGDGVTTCAIHADNCPGQNKNKFVLGYFMWRTMTGQHEKIEYHMQVPGHAKCLIDGGFGLVKKLYRRSDCETMDQLETIVNKSSVTNQAVRYQQWNWRNWKTFLSQYFKPLAGIRQYQYFKFTSEEPGIVTVRGLGEGEKKICILKNPTFRFQTSERPIPIRPQGFSHARKSYLYKTVRPFVRPANQNDFCPAPENNI